MVARLGLHGLAGLIVHHPALADHLAAGVHLLDQGARLAPEVVLKGGFHAVDAHFIIHIIALGLVGLPVCALNGAHPAQKMGGAGGVVLPDGGGGDIHAGETPLFHGGDHVDIHILGEDILGLLHVLAAEIELVQHANEGTGVGVGERLVNKEVLPQAVDDLFRRGALSQVSHAGGGGQVVAVPAVGKNISAQGQGVQQRSQVAEFDFPLAVGIHQGVFICIGEGGVLGDGQGIGPFQTIFPADGDQLHQIGVALRLRPHEGGVEGDLIGGTVAHQRAAVPIQDLSPGGLHCHRVGDLYRGSGPVFIALNDLQIVKDHDKANQQQCQKNGNNQGTDVELLAFHEFRSPSGVRGECKRSFCGRSWLPPG